MPLPFSLITEPGHHRAVRTDLPLDPPPRPAARGSSPARRRPIVTRVPGGGAPARHLRHRRLLLAGLAAAAVLAVASVAIALATRPPLPLDRVEAARRTLAGVRQEMAEAGDPGLAAAVRQAAVMEVELARLRASLFRLDGVEPIAALAGEVETLALGALHRHQAAERAVLAAAGARLAGLEARLATYADSLPAFPADRRLRRHHLRSRLELAAARDDLGAGDFAAVEAGLARADFHIDALASQVDRRVARLSDPALLRRWQEWVDSTVAATRRGPAAVIVEKAGGRCLLVRGGRVVASFAAELGRNGYVGKVHAGDAATPEGRYRVVEKREHGATRYHRALLLDYPNDEDRRAFQAGVRRGQIPRGRGIGGLIEIHGEGGQGKNWTDGCVALTNPDMDRLFAAVAPGTAVTIVGRARIPGVAPGAGVGLSR